MPGLRGYVGVDLVLTDSEAVVIEVNPRLTTAYLGRAFGPRRKAGAAGNVAALALAACAGDLPRRLRQYATIGSASPAAGRVVKLMKGPILGWDVGGANLKAARIEDGSQSEPTVIERPFPLWRERHALAGDPGGDGRSPGRRAKYGGHDDRRAGRLFRHQA